VVDVLVTESAGSSSSLLVFQWDYTTVKRSRSCSASSRWSQDQRVLPDRRFEHGLEVVHGILGVLYVILGVWALVNPRSAFTTLAALVAFFLLFKGIFDLTVAS
jgi:hypothetical protein